MKIMGKQGFKSFVVEEKEGKLKGHTVLKLEE